MEWNLRFGLIYLPYSIILRASPVLQRFCQMGGTDICAPRQICNGAGQFKYPVIGAGRELELAHGGFHQGKPGVVKLAELANFSRAHVGVAQDCVFDF